MTVKHKNRKCSLPWLSDDIKQLMKDRDNALKKAIKSKLSCERQKFASLRNRVIRQLRKAKADFFITIIKNCHGNSKATWDQINKLTGKTSSSNNSIQLKNNGMLLQDPSAVVQTLNEYFVDSVDTIAKFPCEI